MKNNFGLSSAKIKMIALGSMLIDHVGAIIFLRFLKQNKKELLATGSYDDWYQVYRVLRDIGRLAFPLYCFLLVQGFYYTKSRAGYLLRLSIFSVLSELPFDLAFNDLHLFRAPGQMEDYREALTSNNVFLTLTLGFLAMWGIEELRAFFGIKRRAKDVEERGIQYVAFRESDLGRLCGEIGIFAVAAAAASLAQFVFFTDYGAAGVIVILVFYFYHDHPVLASGIGVSLLAACLSSSEWFAIVDALLIAAYDGTYGIKSKTIRNLFYWFYPGHLLALTGIAVWMGF